jgi:hypothetical protein
MPIYLRLQIYISYLCVRARASYIVCIGYMYERTCLILCLQMRILYLCARACVRYIVFTEFAHPVSMIPGNVRHIWMRVKGACICADCLRMILGSVKYMDANA